MMRILVTTLFVGVLAAGVWGQGEDDVSQDRRVLMSLDGLWEGVLAYRDYGTDAQIEIPVRLECEAAAGSAVLARTLTFTDPGRVITDRGVITLADGAYTDMTSGEGVVERYRVLETRFDGTYDWSMVLAGEGTDDGVLSEFRIAQVMDGQTFVSTRRVRPVGDDDGEWLVRNEIRVERIPADVEELVGRWSIDLRPGANAEPYLIEMEIVSVEEGKVSGTFYGGTAIADGRVSGDWGELRFSFTTGDGTGAYHTSGMVRDGVVRGWTWSTGRGFVMRWTGTRSAARDEASSD